jgi:hypothetical protein
MTKQPAKPSPAKAAAPKVPTNYKSKAINVQVASEDEKEFARAVACKLTKPEVSAASVIEAWQQDMHDVNELVCELERQTQVVNGGDLSRAEGMLMAQAHALDGIFSNLAQRATRQEHLKNWEAYMRMAMKAQSQCRMTLETLASIKNPPVVFARQANINNGGQQQVNNGANAEVGEVRAGARFQKPINANYWREVMANGWTPERRARQAALIRTWKPWQQATGPRTAEGKVRAARNGDPGWEWKHQRDEVRAFKKTVAALLRRQRELLKRIA